MIWIDIETRSRCDLIRYGLYNYADHASTEVLIASYAFDNGKVQRWEPWRGQPLPAKLANALADPRMPVYAHNAAFERLVLLKRLKLGIPIERWRCTSYQSRACAMPASLENVTRALAGVQHKKNPRGKQLIRLLSIPRKDGGFNQDPDLLREFGDYCDDDVRAMREISQALPPLADEALEVWRVNEAINDRGLPIDIELCALAVKYAEREHAEANARIKALTGIESARSIHVTRWVHERLPEAIRQLMEVRKAKHEAVNIDDSKSRFSKNTPLDGVKYDSLKLDADVVASILACIEENPEGVDDDVRLVIEARASAASSSVAKFERMSDLASFDGRLRGAFVANGAAQTGRFCVDGNTLIDTPTGAIPICRIQEGDLVRTHKNRYKRVTAVHIKGYEPMLHVVFERGWVIGTGGHRIRIDGEWRRLDELQVHGGAARSKAGGASGEALPARGATDRHSTRAGLRRGCGESRAETCDAARGGAVLGRHKQVAVEGGREQPALRMAQDTLERHPAARVSGQVERQRLHGRAPSDRAESARAEDVAGGLGSAPHRWQPEEQPAAQLVLGDEGGAPETSPGELRKIESVGARLVWDITVEDDESYIAQGLAHHNSSYGAQVHNFPRKCAKDPEAVKALMRRDAKLEGGVLATLKSMLRPAIRSEHGLIVRADWNAIEARGLPWLANTEDSRRYLDAFRDKSRDIYVEQAGASGLGGNRQAGKVVVLSLGYGGAVGALSAMAKAYGVEIGDKRGVVERWRRANTWAVQLWQACERAAFLAIRRKGEQHRAGRIVFGANDASLQMVLPSGRVLFYPLAAIDEADSISYLKSAWKPKATAKIWPRARLWGGLAVENATQATCADILRDVLKRYALPVIGHVHDEVILEADTPKRAKRLADELERAMLRAPAWADSFPLAVETDINQTFRK